MESPWSRGPSCCPLSLPPRTQTQSAEPLLAPAGAASPSGRLAGCSGEPPDRLLPAPARSTGCWTRVWAPARQRSAPAPPCQRRLGRGEPWPGKGGADKLKSCTSARASRVGRHQFYLHVIIMTSIVTRPRPASLHSLSFQWRRAAPFALKSASAAPPRAVLVNRRQQKRPKSARLGQPVSKRHFGLFLDAESVGA